MTAVLVFLAILLLLITVIGHGLWVLLRWIIRAVFQSQPTPPIIDPPPNGFVPELLKDLAATERQLERFHRSGAIDTEDFEELKGRVQAERSRLTHKPTQPPPIVEPVKPIEAAPSVVNAFTEAATPVETARESVVSQSEPVVAQPTFRYESPKVEPPAQSRPKRKPFTEVLTAFMEQSNIRWGEIVGGLLIIGCSTALVVSLWAQISAVPVLKFLIFTTVTAGLFAVGLYTEHRWKLPTTSRGVLTIATLLVPLNFLAIAAVSNSTLPQGALVIASELVAPAVFLCLVYFAGRVITPKWPHLLAAGVLGSSVGQLLIRHFATPENSPTMLIALAGLPIISYAAATAWMLWIALDDKEIDEREAGAIFVSLGALTFAALLPFGLLLYKTPPVSMTMMYVAPWISVAGMPALFSGTLLWQRVRAKELTASRVAGTSIAIFGLFMVLSGMILAWPNPASVVPAALLNFAVLTTLAIVLEFPLAHLVAAICLSIAYAVSFHVWRGNIPWQNLRVASLMSVSVSAGSGHALAHLFLPMVGASLWFASRKRQYDSLWYLISTCVVACVSLLLLTAFGFYRAGDPESVWLAYLFYALGAFFIARQTGAPAFGWIGSVLLLGSSFQAVGPWLGWSFPWQTALLVQATVTAIVAVLVSRNEVWKRALARPLSNFALIASVLALLCLVEANTWETTAMQSQRVFWIAGVWFVSLWLNRTRQLFTMLQLALTAGAILAVKAALQQYEWYSYLPHAFLHPIALQIQGTILLLLSLLWIGVRFLLDRSGRAGVQAESAQRLLNSRFAVDRIVNWIVLGGLSLLAVYGAWSGVRREFTSLSIASWDVAGFPHQYAFGLGSWIVLGLLIIALLSNLKQTHDGRYLYGVVIALTLVCPLLAARWESEIATASAWRWVAAFVFVAGSAPLWFQDRITKSILTKSVERRIRWLLIAATVGPLLLLTLYRPLTISDQLMAGPASGIFYLLGSSLSYSIPLSLVGAAFILYALRNRLLSYAFVAGLFFNLAVTVVFLNTVLAAHAPVEIVLGRLVQLNVIVCSLYTLVWLSFRQKWSAKLEGAQARIAERLLSVQLVLAVVAFGAMIATGAIYVVSRPAMVSTGIASLGSTYAWIGFVLTICAAIWFKTLYQRRFSGDEVCAALLVLSCLLAFTSGRFSTGWEQYRVLMFGFAAVACAVSVLRSIHLLQLEKEWRWNCVLFASLVGAATVFLALRGYEDPNGAWWSITALLLMTALAAALNWQTLRQEYLFAAGALVAIATTFWSLHSAPEHSPELNIVCANVAAGCAAGIVWLWLQLRAEKLAPSNANGQNAVHHLLALGSLGFLVIVAFVGFYNPAGTSNYISPGYEWLALASLTALMFACLWDVKAKYASAGLYLIGLVIGAVALAQTIVDVRRLLWSWLMFLGVYTVVGGLLWRQRKTLIALATQLKMPQRLNETATRLPWLQVFTLFGGATLLLMSAWVVLDYLELPLRISAAAAVTVQVFSLVLVAPSDKSERWRRAAVAVLISGGVLLGWAWLTPGVSGTWMNRAVIAMVEIFGIVALFGLELDKAVAREPEWTVAIRKCIPWLAGIGAVALLFILANEVNYQFQFQAVRVSFAAIATVAVTLAAAACTCILFAVSPKHDPLSLSENRRQLYVYVAEVLVALLFMHVRLTMPWLFNGFFERYWPFVIIGIAYAGVAVSELLRRRDVLVLAHPIERTGVFLPLLPVLGFWLSNPEVDYSLLLFITGGLYGLVSILRKSFFFGVLAVLAGNGGLWYLWHRSADYGFLQHPQLWLVPIAISVLIAAYINREELSEDQMIGVRYLSLIVIYVSSTADIFINGVANSPWLPIILAGLSLAGIFVGILLRVRAFLFIGSLFLLLAVTTMIYFASVNLKWTWLWYVAGIVAGAMILFMFAMFEKKREEMLRVFDGLRQWER